MILEQWGSLPRRHEAREGQFDDALDEGRIIGGRIILEQWGSLPRRHEAREGL
jgi:hypothetical protein